MIRLALVAPSGSGKSTFASMLERSFESRGLRVARLKLAEPLYTLQRQFYEAAGIEVGQYQQNHALLESIADWLRELNAECIIQNFLSRLANSRADVVINDDIRDLQTDWPQLHRNGFKAILVSASPSTRAVRMHMRDDLKSILHSKLDEELKKFPFSYEIDNDGGDLLDLRVRADDFCSALTQGVEQGA